MTFLEVNTVNLSLRAEQGKSPKSDSAVCPNVDTLEKDYFALHRSK